MFELVSQFSCRFLEVEFLYNCALVIKINEQRLGINFEGKRLFLFGLNLNSLNFSLCRCADLNVDWRLKKARPVDIAIPRPLFAVGEQSTEESYWLRHNAA